MAATPLIHAGFGAPERQSRVTVAFRLILAIPHFVVLFALGIAAFVLVFLGWFAALFAGRLPASFARFISEYLGYTTRVYSYVWLLQATYPPFSFGAPYPVHVDIPLTPVRRLAVLFRFILLIPAQIVNTLASLGMGVAGLFIWLIVLVAGRMPLPLFGAIAAVLRFQLRYGGYAFMLTSKYPGELFGDAPVSFYGASPGAFGVPAGPAGPYGAPSPGSAPPVPPPVPGYPEVPQGPAAPAAPPTAADQTPGYWQSRASTSGPVSPPPPPPPPPPAPPVPPESAPAYPPTAPPPPPGAAAPPAGLAAQPPRTGRLVLSKASKRIVATFLVLGVLSYVGFVSADVALISNGSALTELSDANSTLAAELGAAEGARSSCQADSSTCVGRYAAQLELAFSMFRDKVGTISFPESAQADATHLEDVTSQLVAVLLALASDPTAAAQASQAQALLGSFDTSYAQVRGDLA